MKEFNLLGKDLFTITEAAYYCCVKPNKFYRNMARYNIFPIYITGKLYFSKKNIQNSIEKFAIQI